MIAAIKASITPVIVCPFILRPANETAFKKAIENESYKNSLTWSFIVHYVSEGSFFELEETAKTKLNTEHIIYDPIDKTMKITIHKKEFNIARETFREKIKSWCQVLDPEDIRQLMPFPR